MLDLPNKERLRVDPNMMHRELTLFGFTLGPTQIVYWGVNEAAHCLKRDLLSLLLLCLRQQVLLQKKGDSKRRSVVLFIFCFKCTAFHL